MGRAIKVQKSCTNHMVWFYLKNHLVLAACFISQDKGQEPSQQKITNWDPGFYQLMLQRFIGEMPGTFQLCALLNVEYPTILFEDLIHYLLNVGLVCRWMHGVFGQFGHWDFESSKSLYNLTHSNNHEWAITGRPHLKVRLHQLPMHWMQLA